MKKRSAKPKANGERPADGHRQLELAMIRARLALPPEKRTGFLRRRLPQGGTSL